jgi:hypothetical protein
MQFARRGFRINNCFAAAKIRDILSKRLFGRRSDLARSKNEFQRRIEFEDER